MDFHDSPKAKWLKSKCELPQKDNQGVSSIMWVMAMDDFSHVTVLDKKMGCKITPGTINCGCCGKIMLIEDVSAYIEQKLANDIFSKALVLAGKEDAVRHLRHALPQVIRNIIVTEIIQPES